MLDIRGRLDEWICTQPFQRVIREDYRFVPSVSSCRRKKKNIRTACNGESFKDHRARQRWVSSHPSKDPRSCTTSYQFLLRFWSLLLHYHAIQNWRHIPVLVVWSYTVNLVPHLIYMHFSTLAPYSYHTCRRNWTKTETRISKIYSQDCHRVVTFCYHDHDGLVQTPRTSHSYRSGRLILQW